jgi:hypothetical protein
MTALATTATDWACCPERPRVLYGRLRNHQLMSGTKTKTKKKAGPKPRPADVRLHGKYVINEITGCWEWIGALDSKGYSSFFDGQRIMGGHRFVYELHHGEMPEGLVTDHKCRRRSCINPDHLEAVTQRENTLRSPISPAAINARKTHCLRGHELAGNNLYDFPSMPGRRICRTCHLARSLKAKGNRRGR